MITALALIDELRSIEDAEPGFSIVELGLIHQAGIDGDTIDVDFTFTCPGCPAEPILRRGTREKLGCAFDRRKVRAAAEQTGAARPPAPAS